MNQMIIGSFLTRKRKEKNLTQAALSIDIGCSL